MNPNGSQRIPTDLYGSIVNRQSSTVTRQSSIVNLLRAEAEAVAVAVAVAEAVAGGSSRGRGRGRRRSRGRGLGRSRGRRRRFAAKLTNWRAFRHWGLNSKIGVHSATGG